MVNYSIRLDMLKLNDAFLTNIKGRTQTRQCICIPVDNPCIYVGQKGCYLNLVGIEVRDSKYGQTHGIKIELDKETRELLTEEQQRQIPFIGDMHPIEPKRPEVTGETDPGNFTDCPF